MRIRGHVWMRPCTRRITSAEHIIKATSLNDVLVEHAPWCRTAPNAPLIHTKPLAVGHQRRGEIGAPGRELEPELRPPEHHHVVGREDDRCFDPGSIHEGAV